MTRQEFTRRQRETADLFSRAHIVVTPMEREAIEIADFGLGTFEATGLGILVYVNTDRVCAKELALLPGQTCPEHRHPDVAGKPGKEETFRCRWGTVYLYVPGAPAPKPLGKPPAGREKTYTVWHEIVLRPGDQYTLMPDTWHWFQGGPEGAVVSEFSTRSTDEADVFTDPAIRRAPEVT
jgi:D-lyxose ketol-isomerase